MGRPKKDISTDEVERAAGCGLTDAQIAHVLGCSVDTLSRRFAEHIKRGKANAIYSMSSKCFQMGLTDDGVTDRIFWLKCRAGWRDRPSEIEGEESLDAMLMQLQREHGFTTPTPPAEPNGEKPN
jgi:hypothetical protein